MIIISSQDSERDCSVGRSRGGREPDTVRPVFTLPVWGNSAPPPPRQRYPAQHSLHYSQINKARNPQVAKNFVIPLKFSLVAIINSN